MGIELWHAGKPSQEPYNLFYTFFCKKYMLNNFVYDMKGRSTKVYMQTSTISI